MIGFNSHQDEQGPSMGNKQQSILKQMDIKITIKNRTIWTRVATLGVIFQLSERAFLHA